jgi:hypothetical protein
MKSRIYILLVFLFIYALGHSQNLIRNADFEQGPDSSSYGWENRLQGCTVVNSMDGPDDWYKVSLSPDRLLNGDIACDFSPVNAQSGKAYVDFVYDESGKTILKEKLKVGEKYRLTYWVRWQTFQDAATIPSGVKFMFSNSGNVINPEPVSNKADWQYFEIIFTAKSNSQELEIMGTVDKFGGVCLDNISLEKVNNTDSLSNSSAPIPRAELKRFLEK